jgi:type VI secretion system protein ImpH
MSKKEDARIPYPLNLEHSPQGESLEPSCFIEKVRQIDQSNTHRPRTGKSKYPREEAVRFRQVPHIHFAPAEVANTKDDRLAQREFHSEEIMCFFFGLMGPNGPLPSVYSDVILAKAKGIPHPDMGELRRADSLYRQDTGPAAFIDLFNHRFLSFFYRASVSSDKAIDFDRPEESRFHDFIGGFLGLGSLATQNQMDVPDTTALYFSGQFSCPTQHKSGLCSIISDYTGRSTQIGENVAHWIEVPSDCLTKLGAGRNASRLGRTCMLGSRHLDRTMRFRLTIGPMPYADYQQIKPGSATMNALKSLVLLYCNREFVCELNLILQKEEVPPCQLGGGVALGFTTWLSSQERTQDADDFHYELIR